MDLRIKLHLAIRSLNIGGAERQFIALVENIDKSKFHVSVSTMYGGTQEEILESIEDIEYFNLNKKGAYDFYKFYKNYSSLLKTIKPDVIYSFKDEMNLFSLWCKPQESKIIWGIRASNIDVKQYGKVYQVARWLQKVFSSNVDKIILNSYDSLNYHTQSKFDMSKAIVIANGIDANKFKPNQQSREKFRKQYNLKDSDIAIGIVARIDYIKGYLVFAKSAKNFLAQHPNIYFFSIGDGDKDIKKKCEIILDHHPRFLWLGNQSNVEQIYRGLDIYSSSSFGEGFSNSIAEAMSSGLACVVTDVGDSALIVKKVGIVVKPRNIEEFQQGLENIIEKDFKKLGLQSRERILNNFSIKTMVENTQKSIIEVLDAK